MTPPLIIKLQGSGLQLYQKETPTQVFSDEFCEIFKNTFLRSTSRRSISMVKIPLYNYIYFGLT